MKPRKTPPEAQATSDDLARDAAREAREEAQRPAPPPVQVAPVAEGSKKTGLDRYDRNALVGALARGFVLRDPQTRQILSDEAGQPLEFKPGDWEASVRHFANHISRSALECQKESILREAQELQRHILPSEQHAREVEALSAQLKGLHEGLKGGGQRTGLMRSEIDNLRKALQKGIPWEMAVSALVVSPVEPKALAYWKGELEKQIAAG